MKIKLLGMLTVSALLGITLAPATYAQDPEPESTADNPGRRGPVAGGERRRLEGPRNIRRGPRGDPGHLMERLDSDGDERISAEEFGGQPLRRVDALFERRDLDGNGMISLEESESPSRPERRGNRRGRPQIDREAVLACIRETYPDHEPEQNLTLAERFDTLDTDGDAQLSLDEVTAAAETRRTERFELIDADGDAYIVEAELAAFAEERRNLRQVARTCSREARAETALR